MYLMDLDGMNSALEGMNTHIFPFESSVRGMNALPTVLSPCSDLQLGNYTLAKNKYEDTNHIPLNHNVIHSFGRK